MEAEASLCKKVGAFQALIRSWASLRTPDWHLVAVLISQHEDCIGTWSAPIEYDQIGQYLGIGDIAWERLVRDVKKGKIPMLQVARRGNREQGTPAQFFLNPTHGGATVPTGIKDALAKAQAYEWVIRTAWFARPEAGSVQKRRRPGMTPEKLRVLFYHVDQQIGMGRDALTTSIETMLKGLNGAPAIYGGRGSDSTLREHIKALAGDGLMQADQRLGETTSRSVCIETGGVVHPNRRGSFIQTGDDNIASRSEQSPKGENGTPLTTPSGVVSPLHPVSPTQEAERIERDPEPLLSRARPKTEPLPDDQYRPALRHLRATWEKAHADAGLSSPPAWSKRQTFTLMNSILYALHDDRDRTAGLLRFMVLDWRRFLRRHLTHDYWAKHNSAPSRRELGLDLSYTTTEMWPDLDLIYRRLQDAVNWFEMSEEDRKIRDLADAAGDRGTKAIAVMKRDGMSDAEIQTDIAHRKMLATDREQRERDRADLAHQSARLRHEQAAVDQARQRADDAEYRRRQREGKPQQPLTVAEKFKPGKPTLDGLHAIMRRRGLMSQNPVRIRTRKAG